MKYISYILKINQRVFILFKIASLNSENKEFKIQILWAMLSPLKWLDDAKIFIHLQNDLHIQNDCNHTLNM